MSNIWTTILCGHFCLVLDSMEMEIHSTNHGIIVHVVHCVLPDDSSCQFWSFPEHFHSLR